MKFKFKVVELTKGDVHRFNDVKALSMPAVVARRYNPIITEFAQRLKKAGKSNMLIIGAVMRKLLHIIFGVLKSGKPFDANYTVKNT